MLRTGQYIQAKLIESVEYNHWIVSFQGELLKVKNTTDIHFKEGLTLNLQVVRSSPLELKVLSQERRTRPKVNYIA